jgi:hypothetical protein
MVTSAPACRVVGVGLVAETSTDLMSAVPPAVAVVPLQFWQLSLKTILLPVAEMFCHSAVVI